MIRPARALSAAAALSLLAACSPDAPTALQPGAASSGRAGYDQPGMHRQYGTPVQVGDGMARTYVVLDGHAGQAPVEIGIALDEKALDGLPPDMGGHGHAYLLPLPQRAPAPYRFAELDWNPAGHEPPGVYDVPHFDFHFYTISREERASILPSDPDWATKARNVPTGGFVPPYYVVPGDPAAVAVPMMGVHWSDVRSPELQIILGHPELHQPFTKTFIYGSWNGRFTFYEPMVTREYLLSHPDDLTEIPVPSLYPQPGYYPTAYRVAYDAQAREYRVALAGLVER